MAKAKKHVGYKLHLSDDEAQVLLKVFEHIGGHPDDSARKQVAAINKALYDSGCRLTTDFKLDPKSNSIYFLLPKL